MILVNAAGLLLHCRSISGVSSIGTTAEMTSSTGKRCSSSMRITSRKSLGSALGEPRKFRPKHWKVQGCRSESLCPVRVRLRPSFLFPHFQVVDSGGCGAEEVCALVVAEVCEIISQQLPPL